ncbi:acyloxyacyl hydrolase [Yoonia litorea]|uniref:Lipid A 3-O-deacylase (PagL) n=1 Tax=Yoonia litorea TaxID=1123755 RepID=A0A1I6M5M5_9RHOB|nr:acyloxyacyl hydrolase [Yoonia litorea]SFS10996.1 Lipid A 3-O-deacylase (PagL) [Yoonia litorea]
MDSRFAVFFFIMGGLDGYLNECPTDCFGESTAPERWHLQYGETYFQEEITGDEFYLSYDLPHYISAVQPTIGASVTDTSDIWIGAGAKWSTERISDGPVYLELSLMPGLYLQGDGEDLGFPMQFRGSLSAGYHFDNGASLSVVFDHRSNANTSSLNPGLETLGLRLSWQTQ